MSEVTKDVLTKDDFLFVYSSTLYHFLKANGQRYVCTGLHEKSRNKFWLFPKTSEVKSLLDEYDERKQDTHAR